MTNKTGTTIFHLEILATGKHHYFGSIAAIFEVFTADRLGVIQHSLYDFDIEIDKPYKNKLCIIRKGVLIRKHGKRRPQK